MNSRRGAARCALGVCCRRRCCRSRAAWAQPAADGRHLARLDAPQSRLRPGRLGRSTALSRFRRHRPGDRVSAGLGNTAHAFDNFAPSFTDRFHVVALTRRGFGESSHPETGYETPRLVEDIRAAIDKLHLGRVILIGHSIAGEEMTRFAGKYPDRVAKLVYLDAAYDRVAADSMLSEIFPVPPDVPPRPQPTAADTATPAAYVDFVHRTRGVDIPESDIRDALSLRRLGRGDRLRLPGDERGASAVSPRSRAGARDLCGDRHGLAARALAAQRSRAR